MLLAHVVRPLTTGLDHTGQDRSIPGHKFFSPRCCFELMNCHVAQAQQSLSKAGPRRRRRRQCPEQILHRPLVDIPALRLLPGLVVRT
jgi:hypothetical protein